MASPVRLKVRAAREGEALRHVAGPGDLNETGPGWVVQVEGAPKRDHDFALWAPALGQAVLRGASVRRLP